MRRERKRLSGRRGEEGAEEVGRVVERVLRRTHAPHGLREDCRQAAWLLCWRHRRHPDRERIALFGVRAYLEGELRHGRAEALGVELRAGRDAEPEGALAEDEEGS